MPTSTQSKEYGIARDEFITLKKIINKKPTKFILFNIHFSLVCFSSSFFRVGNAYAKPPKAISVLHHNIFIFYIE